ncbi:MAG: hypothetical protein H0X35_13640 [Pseudonocardiales bacterium]|nr:hypothetical protein [Pseudonocardiales bacterium]
MSFLYRNSNTGDRHEADERDTRLDALDNWELVAPGDDEDCPSCGRPPVPAGSDGILSRPGMRPDEAFSPAPVVRVDSAGDIERPTDRASKAVWAAYAESRGADPAGFDALSRDEIAARYGK